MGHTLFTGITESGKTTLARYCARVCERAKQRVIVFDPVQTSTRGGGWGENARIFNDFNQMVEFIEDEKVTHAHLFIDEAMEYFGVGDKENHWFATRGRHLELFCNFIAQRPKMLAPNVRTQCRTAYLFRLAPKDAEMIGEDFGFEGIGKIPLNAGEFLILKTKDIQVRKSTLDSVLAGEYKGKGQVSDLPPDLKP